MRELSEHTYDPRLAASSEGGVNRAFEEWGSALLHRYGKSRAQTYEDYGLNYLSYSTDNVHPRPAPCAAEKALHDKDILQRKH